MQEVRPDARLTGTRQRVVLASPFTAGIELFLPFLCSPVALLQAQMPLPCESAAYVRYLYNLERRVHQSPTGPKVYAKEEGVGGGGGGVYSESFARDSSILKGKSKLLSRGADAGQPSGVWSKGYQGKN